MGSELLKERFPETDSSTTVSDSSKKQTYETYTSVFEAVCPYYMSIGVSYHDFWDGNFEICKYAQQAEKLRKKRRNQDAWWNSIYTFRALCDASVLFHDFVDKKPELKFSTEVPLPLSMEEAEEQQKAKREREMEAFSAQMEAFAKAHNASLRKEKEEQQKRKEGE